MKTAQENGTGLPLAVAYVAVHCDQRDAYDSFASYHQTLTIHGTLTFTTKLLSNQQIHLIIRQPQKNLLVQTKSFNQEVLKMQKRHLAIQITKEIEIHTDNIP